MTMGNMLKKVRVAAGLTQEQLADLVGTTYPTIGRLENGKRDLDEKWRAKIAQALGVHPANLLYDAGELIAAQELSEQTAVKVDVDFERLPIIGKVEAGSYSSATELHQDDWGYVSAPKDDRYSGKKRFCLEVKGPSMNLEFMPGSLVICISMIELDEAPQDGAVYVVDHTQVHGEVESTLKELKLMPDGRAYLWPRSNDPLHQLPIEMNGNKGENIRLRAKVVGSYSRR